MISKESQNIQILLQDKARTALVLATIPEFMAIRETYNFISANEEKLNIGMGPIFINKTPEDTTLLNNPEFNKAKEELPSRLLEMIDYFHNREISAQNQIQDFYDKFRKSVYTLPFIAGGISNPHFFDILELTLNKYGRLRIQDWTMLSDLFESQDIIVCCGCGGVGKTTVSATLGLKAAEYGKKAIVLTIDPARRLADSLGIGTLTNKPKKVDLPYDFSEKCGQ